MLRPSALPLLAVGCAAPGADTAAVPACDPDAPPIALSGDVFLFSPDGGTLDGAVVSLVGDPSSTAQVDAKGSFHLEGVPSGSPATLELTHADAPPTRSGTLHPCGAPLDRVALQVPTLAMYDLLTVAAGVEPDPDRCQLATTVTRAGASLYGGGDPDDLSHGQEGASAWILPRLPEGHGPIYFDLVGSNVVFPNPDLEATTRDGGVLWANVPPGEYLVGASAPGFTFSSVHLSCAPGRLVNAAPPWGVNVLSEPARRSP